MSVRQLVQRGGEAKLAIDSTLSGEGSNENVEPEEVCAREEERFRGEESGAKR
jgi:hypothetical protein